MKMNLFFRVLHLHQFQLISANTTYKNNQNSFISNGNSCFFVLALFMISFLISLETTGLG